MKARHSISVKAAAILTAAVLFCSCSPAGGSGQETKSTSGVNEIDGGVSTNGYIAAKLEDGHWWGIPLYGGGSVSTYAGALNGFRQRLGDSVKVYSMAIPTSGEYYLPEKFAPYNASQQKAIDNINSRLDGVIPVPVSQELKAHTGEHIYLRTDYHWSALGAYYAAKCFAETAGLPFADISTMERVDNDGYVGSMYAFTECSDLLADPETFTYYIPSSAYTATYYDTAFNSDGVYPLFRSKSEKASYSVFLGGDDNCIVKIKTDAGTGRRLVIFKDSYGNALIPFLLGSFDEITVCDMRYFRLEPIQFITESGATDLLFAASTFSTTGANADELAAILNNK